MALNLTGESVMTDEQALACAMFALELGATNQELARWVVAVQVRLAAMQRLESSIDRMRLDEATLTTLRAFVASQHANRDHPVTADAIRAVLDAQKEANDD